MANGIIGGVGSVVDGIVTISLVVASGGAPVNNFDLVLGFDASKATWIDAVPATGWSAVGNVDESTPNILSVAGANTTAAQPGGTLFTVRFALSNPADTSLALTYSGTFNDAGTIGDGVTLVP